MTTLSLPARPKGRRSKRLSVALTVSERHKLRKLSRRLNQDSSVLLYHFSVAELLRKHDELCGQENVKAADVTIDGPHKG